MDSELIKILIEWQNSRMTELPLTNITFKARYFLIVEQTKRYEYAEEALSKWINENLLKN